MRIQSGASESNGNVFGSPADSSSSRPNHRAGVSREFHNLLADFEQLISQTTAMTAEDLARVKAQLGDRITQAKASLDNVGGAIGERARRSAAVTNEYVHDEPWKAIGIGAAIGLLLGVVVARR
jgi:ElaB/YqjD/DUF883 family membrane-anchored ribosome-binding protein